KQVLTAAGAEIKKELPARLQPLAYQIKKTVEHKSSSFREAYFGAFAFAAEPAAMAAIDTKLKQSPLVIRHLLMILPARAFAAPAKPRVIPTPAAEPLAPEASAPSAPVTEKPEKTKPKKKMSTEALDQEIDQLLVAP